MLKVLQIFSNSIFIPQADSYLGKPSLIWLQVASDLMLAFFYFSISLLLTYFLRQFSDLPFQGTFWLFCALIIACGTTHLMSLLSLWHPSYRHSGLLKTISARVSFSFYTDRKLMRSILQGLARRKFAQKTTGQKLTQRLSLLVQQTPLGVIEWTPDFKIVDWNPAAERIFGYSKSEALGCHGIEMVATDTDKKKVNQVWQQLLLQQGGTRSTNKNCTKEGREIYCEWYNTPLIDPEGRVVGVASLVEDVTERKLAEDALQQAKTQLEIRVEERTQELKQAIAQLQSEIVHRQLVEAALREREEQYRSVVDNVKEVIFQTDANGCWTFLNLAWSEITGFAIAHSIDQPFLDYVHPNDRQSYLEQFQPLIEGKKEYCRHETRYLTNNGNFRWIEVLAQLTFNADRTVTGTCGTLNDITERKQAELALAERERYLAASEAKLRKQHMALSELAQCQSIYSGNLSVALQEITETVAHTLDTERCSVWFYNYDRSLIQCVDLYELTPNHHSASFQLPCAEYPSYFKALETEGIIVASDAHTHPNTLEFSASYLNPLGITSILDAPIRLGGMTVGVLCTQHTGPKREWALEEENFVSTTAYMVALAMEASHRATAQQALRESEERFRSLVAHIPGVVYRCAYDADRTVEFISDVIAELSGYPPADFLHNQVRTFSSLIEPQDLARVKQVVAECVAQRQPYVLEYQIIQRDGTVKLIYDKGQGVFAVDGSLLWLDGVLFDITEHKQTQEELRVSEAQFRQLTENIREVFFLTAPDLSQILYISPAYEEVWGRTTKSLYEQPSTWFDSVHPEDRDRVITAFMGHLQQEQYFEEEYRIVQPDGLERWVWVRTFHVLNEMGSLERIAGIAEDITKRKRAEAEILNALFKEKEVGDLKSRFVSITSHEFRTPLTTIMSTTELLEHYEWTKEEEVEQLHLIQNAVRQMLHLLEDLLFVGTADAGQLQFNPEPLDLKEFCWDVVAQIQQRRSLKPTPADCQHTITFVSCDRTLLACMDKKLLQQLLSNLLLNAIKYSPSGDTVQFELSCQGDNAIFQIQDQGIGIPKEDLPRLFEFFYRAKNVGAISGTGLGLAIVQQCVDLHGGQITVDSEVGVGTCFTVTLPLKNHFSIAPYSW